MSCPFQPEKRRNDMKGSTLILVPAMTLVFSVAAFAQQRPHPGGGPPATHGTGNGPGVSESREAGTNAHTDISHASPSEVLSHNTAIAGKIKTLTGQDAVTACGGFKNLGQCVAAAHLAKNLDIPGGFDALKAKVNGTGAVSLGKAIGSLAPRANSKAEIKKATQQQSDGMTKSSSSRP